jgi:chromosome segregation ATPase
MKRRTQTFVLMMAVFLLFATSISAQAQGRGGGQSKGRTTTAGQAGRGQSGKQGQQGQQGGTQDRKRIQATDQQRDQLRTCTSSADRIRQQAREMANTASGAGFKVDQARQQRDQLREQIQTMQQEHERLVQGLSQEQKAQLQERIRVMDQQHARVRNQLQAMDQEFGQAQPNGKRISQQARETERAMNEWQKQYRNMSSEMGVKP